MKKFAVKKIVKYAVREFITKVDDKDAHLLLERPPWTVIMGGDKGASHYVARIVRGEVLMLHKIICGAGPGEPVRHINGDSLDNRRENLLMARDRVKEVE